MDAIVAGRRRLGKSTLAYRLARSLHPNCTINFEAGENQFRGVGPILSNPDTLPELLEAGTYQVIVVHPSGDVAESFEETVQILKPFGDFAILIDESHRLQTAQRINPGLDWLIRMGPRAGTRNASGQCTDISVIQTVHGMMDVHKASRRVATDYFLFGASEPHDIEVISEWFGDEVAMRVARLGRAQVIHVGIKLDGQRYYSYWDEGENWYVNIARSDSRTTSRTAELATA